ncbi:nicotinate-nucleotide/dimethylbenzimidazole phosphoribosyltransferase [Methylocella silvestris BL2]|uniref:Nicotinate-nucleotide--dimethylbenzimidazole phosphoribosyltransferase n=1 Tax=Methylocella silvestris (strain DSM 15510 / CIP 108128 / LMG 27833 / NCIMB 13906 / BL2) TaxID=395965 RepID=COBT_METSB|nr:nicotinate-nucleotide--dimethylbenzimidazole phosphoribosyltransferase [Methylocella silvestris]B8ERB9.1 RecName: Full=Nicotinate-nucleotide--dimethylbenzimidazole phosphoribosyltransferase; Short=NN:DBI PRT; AltName: Full=N(1)-alpha-phosphoribosyltransferase [Methylocella silvestris BL2]ACK50303.1 nicotinate-nucleotide/dimethylbenzimidazole phosphoribosyltransferase [Methylocella silvestris BL2]
MLADAAPLDSIRHLIGKMPPASERAAAAARARQAELTKPQGSLGRLEEIAAFLASWQGKPSPTLDRPLVAVFAANHGVVAKGVSAYPPSVTRAMMQNFSAGGAAINQICGAFGVGLKVFELALDIPTKDITEEPAMEAAETAATFAFGMEAIDGGVDLLCVGEMGIGNTTVAAAIFYALYGGSAADWVGRGAGVEGEALARKMAAVETAVALHRPFLSDPLEVMRRLGGREIAAMAGAIVAARMQNIPVVLDGYVVCAAAAILHAVDKSALDHCLAGHLSAEGAHGEVLRRLGKIPLLDLGMRLGEGSGAALAVGLIKAAVACHTGMATFAEAQVAGKVGG